jgi:hypothetical protein
MNPIELRHEERAREPGDGRGILEHRDGQRQSDTGHTLGEPEVPLGTLEHGGERRQRRTRAEGHCLRRRARPCEPPERYASGERGNGIQDDEGDDQ